MTTEQNNQNKLLLRDDGGGNDTLAAISGDGKVSGAENIEAVDPFADAPDALRDFFSAVETRLSALERRVYGPNGN